MTGNHTSDLVKQLKAVFGELAGRDLDGADPRATFFQLGFDSLLLTQVASALKKRFGVKITFRQLLEELTTFEAIAQSLEQLKPAATAPDLSPAGVKTTAASPLMPPLEAV
jgi:acyl carrier protein